MTNNKHIDADQVTRMHCQGMTPERIAAQFGSDVETIEYFIDREFMRWGAQYGYDN
jgi:hypothetical protein